MPSITTLPNELLLKIFSFLPGPSLFTATRTTKLWRSLILTTSTLATTPRIDLWSLYHHALTSTPDLPPAPPKGLIRWISQEGIDSLVSELPHPLPVAFEIWLREWPSPALAGLIWPGLDRALGLLRGHEDVDIDLEVEKLNDSFDTNSLRFRGKDYAKTRREYRGPWNQLIVDESRILSLRATEFTLRMAPDWEYRDRSAEQLEGLGYGRGVVFDKGAECRVYNAQGVCVEFTGCYRTRVFLLDFRIRDGAGPVQLVLAGAGREVNGSVWRFRGSFCDVGEQLTMQRVHGQHSREGEDWLAWLKGGVERVVEERMAVLEGALRESWL